MAHYAFLDNQNVVREVIAGNDESNATDWEAYYSAIRGMRCLRTSFNTVKGVHVLGGTPFRGNYAGIGFAYLDDLDAFIPPCPGDGWTLDTEAGVWVQA
jgi:hypothetical protein